jgi:hypothetical protein
MQTELLIAAGVLKSAVISQDGRYRYCLKRGWSDIGSTICFIGLNPSTADGELDDPTIRRCIAFAESFGGRELIMVNLFAWRATDSSELLRSDDPIGPDNDQWLERSVEESDVVIAAWGNKGNLVGRAARILTRFAGKLHALKITKTGHPSHPLYLRKSCQYFPI